VGVPQAPPAGDASSTDLVPESAVMASQDHQNRTILLGSSSRIARSSLWKGQDVYNRLTSVFESERPGVVDE
jgi:hypothetical protein